MDEKIRGGYPGGPSHEGTPLDGGRRPRVERVEELEERERGRSLRRRARTRRNRALATIVATAAVAGAIGWLLGSESRATAEEVLADQERDVSPLEEAISREVSRTLLELWRMEEAEARRRE